MSDKKHSSLVSKADKKWELLTIINLKMHEAIVSSRQSNSKDEFVLLTREEMEQLVTVLEKAKQEVELIQIIGAKIDERERMGYDNLTDSDIADILSAIRKKKLPFTRKDLERFGIE